MAHAVEHASAPARAALSAAPATRLPAPTLEHVWIGLAIVAAVFACALQPLESIDYWWSVRLGSLIAAKGADELWPTITAG